MVTVAATTMKNEKPITPMWVNVRCTCNRLLIRVNVELYESKMASGKLELKCHRCGKVSVFH
jgi:phage FluMu protein Com